MKQAYNPLLQPFKLGGLQLKNRLFSASHEPAYSEQGLPQERYRLYHEEKAKGGIGLTMIGGSTVVSRDSPASFGNIDASRDEVMPHWRTLAAAVHRYECAVITQISHLGRRTSWAGADWLPILSASPVREMAHKQFSKEAEQHDIDRIVSDYADASARAEKAGLDGVEILAHAHLPGSFLSPSQNLRSDSYGGSITNRLRFTIEILAAIRARVGSRFVVGVRLSIGAISDDGPSVTEAKFVAQRLQDSGHVDYLSLVGSTANSDRELSFQIPAMGGPTAPYLATVKAFRQGLDIPILHSCGVNDLATARFAIESGATDLVGMTRAHMADPHILLKSARGEEHRIRPCVGAGYCIDQIYDAGAAYCLHNPATGREHSIPHVTPETSGRRKRVVVIGAGPAGLEAARVLAECRHEVIVYEAGNRSGGQVLTASRAPRRSNLLAITDWLTSEAELSGAQFHFNRYIESQEVLNGNPDVVLVATGGVPTTPPDLVGSDQTYSTWDALDGISQFSGDVLIYDESGREPALSCAEYLVGQGVKVTVATRDRSIAVLVGGTNYPPALTALYAGQTTILTDVQLVEVARSGNRFRATLKNEFTLSAIERSFDQVIVEYGTTPADEIYQTLKDRAVNRGEIDIDALADNKPQPLGNDGLEGFQLYRIGDALASRNIHAAIYEARRLCLQI